MADVALPTTPIYWPQPGARPPRPRYVPLRFRPDGWVIALTVLTTLGVLLTLALWTYLVYRIVKSRSRLRTIWPGQVLLVGILGTYILLYAFLPRQTPSSCGVIRFGIGCAYSIIFSTLLLKLLVTIARHKGVFLPVTVEILLLILAIGVQVAISSNWLIVLPPAEKMLIYRNGNTSCNIGLYSWLHSLGYIMLLIIVGLVTSVAARKIKDNHREPVFIGLAFGFSAPLWLVWILVCALMPNEPNIEEKCLSFGLLANATLVLFAMFIPKVRQLSAIGAVGLYREDRPIPKTMTEMSVQKIYYPIYPENGTRPSQCWSLHAPSVWEHPICPVHGPFSSQHSPASLSPVHFTFSQRESRRENNTRFDDIRWQQQSQSPACTTATIGRWQHNSKLQTSGFSAKHGQRRRDCSSRDTGGLHEAKSAENRGSRYAHLRTSQQTHGILNSICWAPAHNVTATKGFSGY